LNPDSNFLSSEALAGTIEIKLQYSKIWVAHTNRFTCPKTRGFYGRIFSSHSVFGKPFK